MKLNQNSLFAILLRSPWWLSVLIGMAIVIGFRLLIPDVFAGFAALPFFGIAGYVGWRQLRVPSATRVAAALEAWRARPAEDFSRAVEEGFRREGYVVKALAGPQADFELVK